MTYQSCSVLHSPFGFVLDRVFRSCLVALVFVFPVVSSASEVWIPLEDRGLEVQAGSVLDFSALVESGVAGRYGWAKATPDGHVAFERKPAAQRFLCASFAFSPSSGGMPTAEQSRRLAVQLRRTGYGLARLHFADAMLMSGRERDFDFDPVQLDRFFQFTAALKEQGIYWVVDGLTSDNGAYGDPDRNRWKKKHDLKRELLTSAQAQAHWARLVTELWGRRNPYTGLTTLQDPALLGVILVNEGSLGFLSTIGGNRWPESLGAPFASWVTARYANDEALRKAWGKDLLPSDAIGAKSLAVPQSIRANGPRAGDFMRFITEIEQAAYRRMDAHVRGLGFDGLTTAYDNWGFLQADVSRSAASWVDMHSYAALPTAFSQPGSTIEHRSVFDKGARWVRELTQARQWGKPFTVSEWGQPFWNRWRHESVALLPAVAAHQGWDAICQFAENPVSLTYAGTLPKRLEAIHPFAVGVDPVLRMGERLAALLYVRGDVSASDARLRLDIDGDALLAQGRGWEQVPELIGRLTLAVPSGLSFGTTAKPAGSRELVLSAARDGPGWMRIVDKVASRLRLDAGPIEEMRSNGLLSSSNMTDPRVGLIETDTGEVRLDGTLPQLSIVTDRSLVIVMRGTAGSAGGLSIRGASAPALFSVSSLDGQRVAESRRLLMFVLTDAINTGMTFDDAERRTIRTLGRVPPQVSPVRATATVASTAMARALAYPLSLAGERRGPGIPVAVRDGALSFEIDTAKLDGGPALAFEIVPN